MGDRAVEHRQLVEGVQTSSAVAGYACLAGRYLSESVRGDDGWAEMNVDSEYEAAEPLDAVPSSFDVVVLATLELPTSQLDRTDSVNMITSPGGGRHRRIHGLDHPQRVRPDRYDDANRPSRTPAGRSDSPAG